jgi:hypothetical protein
MFLHRLGWMHHWKVQSGEWRAVNVKIPGMKGVELGIVVFGPFGMIPYKVIRDHLAEVSSEH